MAGGPGTLPSRANRRDACERQARQPEQCGHEEGGHIAARPTTWARRGQKCLGRRDRLRRGGSASGLGRVEVPMLVVAVESRCFTDMAARMALRVASCSSHPLVIAVVSLVVCARRALAAVSCMPLRLDPKMTVAWVRPAARRRRPRAGVRIALDGGNGDRPGSEALPAAPAAGPSARSPEPAGSGRPRPRRDTTACA